MRYEVREVPFGNTPNPDINARWTVVDLRPECETFETKLGDELVEEQAPAWRNVAFCMKRGHAEMICSALNKEAAGFVIFDDASDVPLRVWHTPPNTVSVTNISKHPLTVGARTLQPGETIDV